MARKLIWVGQAERVAEFELPADFIDPHCPDLASVRCTAICVGMLIAKSTRLATSIPFLDERRIVRVWFDLRRHVAYAFAIEASYDGGYTFEDPLLRYCPIERPDDA